MIIDLDNFPRAFSAGYCSIQPLSFLADLDGFSAIKIVSGILKISENQLLYRLAIEIYISPSYLIFTC